MEIEYRYQPDRERLRRALRYLADRAEARGLIGPPPEETLTVPEPPVPPSYSAFAVRVPKM